MGCRYQQFPPAKFNPADIFNKYIADPAGGAQLEGCIVKGILEAGQGQPPDHCRQGHQGEQIALVAEEPGSLATLQHEQLLVTIQDSGLDLL
jgi:hypothetical protein